MRSPPGGVKKPEVLIINSKRLRQAAIRRLLDVWADAMGLTVKAVGPDAPLDTCNAPDNCEMTIISVGSASIQDARQHALIDSVRRLILMVSRSRRLGAELTASTSRP